MSDKRYYLSNFTKEQLAEMCATEDARTDGRVHLVYVLQAENTKLRELLSIMAYCNQFRRDCDGCSLNGAAGIITERSGCDELLASLRELGIEVDG